MTSNKKYTYRLVQEKTGWAAEIVRRVTSKKTAVSKSQDGFATEAEAKAWGEKELVSFLENLGARNKRDSAQRQQQKQEQALREEAYQKAKRDAESIDPVSSDSEVPDSA